MFCASAGTESGDGQAPCAFWTGWIRDCDNAGVLYFGCSAVVAHGVSRRVHTAIKTIVSAPWFCVADVLTYNHISSLRGLLPLLPIFKSRVKRKDGRRIFMFLHSLVLSLCMNILTVLQGRASEAVANSRSAQLIISSWSLRILDDSLQLAMLTGNVACVHMQETFPKCGFLPSMGNYSKELWHGRIWQVST